MTTAARPRAVSQFMAAVVVVRDLVVGRRRRMMVGRSPSCGSVMGAVVQWSPEAGALGAEAGICYLIAAGSAWEVGGGLWGSGGRGYSLQRGTLRASYVQLY